MTARNQALPDHQAAHEVLASASRDAQSIEDIRLIAGRMGARALFDSSISEGYPDDSLDLVLPDSDKDRRVFVHGIYPHAEQEDAEAMLTGVGLNYFSESARTSRYSFREMPIVTVPILSHNMTKPNAQIIAQTLIGPAIRVLFDQEGLIPTRATLNNLVHVERLKTTDGSDQIETGLRFIPPYRFEVVDSLDFAITALKNAADYGDRFRVLLAGALQQQG